MNELNKLTALEIARRVARRDVSCVEVIDAHLQRIRDVNPALNAIVHVLDDEARAAARAADAQVKSGAPLGPLHGVPITVKVNIDMAGQPTTWGVVPLAHAAPPVDAPVVERMRAAGAIPIGRTNCPDLALRWHTDSSLHGLTRNPWHAGRSAGGSSGGEAASLASGMSAIGLGNDLGGSLRVPANACGIAAIRPSMGRVPDAGLVPVEDRLLAVQLMNSQGPMARNVADVRAALSVLMGAHPRDPWSIDAPLDYPKDGKKIRVAVIAEPPGGSTHPEVAATVRRAAQALADAGYAVEEACPPRYTDAIDLWAQFVMGDFDSVLDQLKPLFGADALKFLDAFAQLVPPLPDKKTWSHMMAERDGIARAWSLFMADRPLVLSPVSAQLQVENGFDCASPEGVAEMKVLMRPAAPANALGLPAACVPAGSDKATGLPIGVMIMGRRMRDGECLDAAQAIEKRVGVMTPIDPR